MKWKNQTVHDSEQNFFYSLISFYSTLKIKENKERIKNIVDTAILPDIQDTIQPNLNIL